MQLALLTSTPESDPLITQFCTLDAIQDEGTTPATRFDLDRLDENTATAVDCSDGSHSFYRLDLRSRQMDLFQGMDCVRRVRGSSSSARFALRGLKRSVENPRPENSCVDRNPPPSAVFILIRRTRTHPLALYKVLVVIRLVRRRSS